MKRKPAKTRSKTAPRSKPAVLRPRPIAFIEPNAAELEILRAAPILLPTCDKACTAIKMLLSKRVVPAHGGVGSAPLNVDGYRKLSAYVISDPLSSNTMRGFSLRLSFSLYPFVQGTGVVGQADCFFNFDTDCAPGVDAQKLNVLGTSDQKSSGGLPRYGGRDLAHILHTPVLGPYVSATAMNEDSVERSVEVQIYLST
ncbi:MAG: hypothetical protein ABI769_07740 [Pseudomonadota bacterium]